MTKQPQGAYARTIDRAAVLLLALSFRPDLASSLIEQVAAAVAARGGRVDEECVMRFDLHAVLDAIVERAMTILSAAMRDRLPGVADEIDGAFAEKLHRLLGRLTSQFATV